jgi:SAM-dependent methyltransferase
MIPRQQSYFFEMRRFHNNIKRDLIQRYAKNVSNLLDLACGKGGDLQKWNDNNIKNVVGYDINSESIDIANTRKREFKNLKTKVAFNVLDLSTNIVNGNKNVDVITSMFAFHYFFKNNDTFETIMTTIEQNLKSNGYFIGTFFDGEILKNIDAKIYNEYFKITFDDNGNQIPLSKNPVFYEKNSKINSQVNVVLYDETPLDSDDFFGRKISVMMKETVLNESMDEYIVDFNNFVERLRQRGFVLIESKLFRDINSNKFNMKQTEKDVSFLNRYFVFKRI